MSSKKLNFGKSAAWVCKEMRQAEYCLLYFFKRVSLFLLFWARMRKCGVKSL